MRFLDHLATLSASNNSVKHNNKWEIVWKSLVVDTWKYCPVISPEQVEGNRKTECLRTGVPVEIPNRHLLNVRHRVPWGVNG